MKCLKYLVWGNTETCQGPTFCDLCWWPRLERMWRLAKAREGPGPLVYPLKVDSPLQPWWGRLWIGTYNLRKSWPRILKPTNPFQKNSISAFLQGIFPTQGLKLHLLPLLHCITRENLFCLTVSECSKQRNEHPELLNKKVKIVWYISKEPEIEVGACMRALFHFAGFWYIIWK